MSYTGSRSYGAGRIYSVPHYNVNSQHIGRQRQNNASGVSSNTAPSPDGSSSASGSRLHTPAMTSGSSAGTTPPADNTMQRLSGSTTNSSTTGTTPGSMTSPGSPSGTAPGSMPRSTPRTTPDSPSETAPRGSIPGIHIPGTPPAGTTAPQRSTPQASPSTDSQQAPEMMPNTGSQSPAGQRSTAPAPPTSPSSPGSMPGTGGSAMPRTAPGTGTMPGTGGPAMPRTAPGTGTMPGTGGPAMPRTTPGTGTMPGTGGPAMPRTTPGTGTMPGTGGPAMPRTAPGMRPAVPPANQRGTTPTVPETMPGGTHGPMPGTNHTPMPQAPMHRNIPGNMPQTMPGSMHTAPQAVPGALPNSMQGTAPGFMPATPGSTNGTTPGINPGTLPNGTINGMEERGSEGFHYFINNNLPLNNPYKAPMGIPLYPLYGYDSCEELDKDAAYMKQLYPGQAKAILPYIESECDQMEYDGSVMFDEYPDRVALDRIVDRIYEKVKDLDEDEAQVEAKSIYFYPQRRYGSGLRDIITLLLLNEIFNRRRRYRSRRRWF